MQLVPSTTPTLIGHICICHFICFVLLIVYYCSLGTSFTNLWTSVPLLLTGETSATVYFCSSNLSTLEIALFGPRSFRSAVYVRGAISQVAPTPSSWNYTDIITCFFFCDEHSIMVYFSAYIPHREHYVNLLPNTLYSVAIIGCITDDDYYISQSQCTIENSSGYVFEYYLGFVSTRPRGEDLTVHNILLHT